MQLPNPCSKIGTRTYVYHIHVLIIIGLFLFLSRGRIKFFTHPPEQSSLPSHVSADIVQAWSAAFDMSAVKEEEKEDLSG